MALPRFTIAIVVLTTASQIGCAVTREIFPGYRAMAERQDREECARAKKEYDQSVEQARRALLAKTTVKDPKGYVRDGNLKAAQVVTIDVKPVGADGWSCEQYLEEGQPKRLSVTFGSQYPATLPHGFSGTVGEIRAQAEPIVVTINGPSDADVRQDEERRHAEAMTERTRELHQNLKPGDRCLVKNRRIEYDRAFEQALVVEVKPPLAQIQLFNPDESVWVEIDALRAPGDGCDPGHDIC